MLEMIDWTAIFMAIITLLGTIITKVAVPYLKSKTTEKQRDNIDWWVQVAVVYIEKNYNMSEIGALKKDKVKELINDMGLNISELELEILIDEVVERIINKPWKEFTGADKVIADKVIKSIE